VAVPQHAVRVSRVIWLKVTDFSFILHHSTKSKITQITRITRITPCAAGTFAEAGDYDHPDHPDHQSGKFATSA
jgi:hypothetical protein